MKFTPAAATATVIWPSPGLRIGPLHEPHHLRPAGLFDLDSRARSARSCVVIVILRVVSPS